MTSFGYRLNPRYAIKECLSCGALYTQNCSCSKRNIEDKTLVPKPPKNCARCAKCGHPVNGPYRQGCALLREKLEEDLVSYLKYFHDTSESSGDSTNIVNTPREPFVVKQDHGVKSSQNPPPIDKCCCECEKRIEEEQAANARYWKIPAYCDDADDYDFAITPILSTKEPIDSLKNIEYVEASPHDSELVSLEVAEIVILEVEEIKDDNLREKLLNVHLLIANIEAL
nr:hypothetical protein [Tanacetum cinerariifolium]